MKLATFSKSTPTLMFQKRSSRKVWLLSGLSLLQYLSEFVLIGTKPMFPHRRRFPRLCKRVLGNLINHLETLVRWRLAPAISDSEFQLVDYTVKIHNLQEYAYTKLVMERVATSLWSKSSIQVRVLGGNIVFQLRVTIDISKPVYRWIPKNFPIQGWPIPRLDMNNFRTSITRVVK